jgi:hypothetical protein
VSDQKGRILARERIEISEVHGDLSQVVVRITVDKLTLILHKHAEKLGRRRDWIAPLGVLITLVVTFTTTEFKAALLSADSWRAIFSTVLTVGWLAASLRYAWNSEDVDSLVERIKQQK